MGSILTIVWLTADTDPKNMPAKKWMDTEGGDRGLGTNFNADQESVP